MVRIEAENAAATNGDTLRTFQVATTITGRDLPAPMFVADFPVAASLTLTPGTQPLFPARLQANEPTEPLP